MPVAVITGASSGLGREYVDAAISQFPMIDEFWLIARRKDNLKEIASRHPDKTIVAISLDLQLPESIDMLNRLLKEHSPEIRLLINSAGYAQCSIFYSSNMKKQGGMVDLNCNALIEITRMCLPYFTESGLIVNVSSVAAFLPMPRMTVYSATKAFVLAFSKALREELKPRGISVISVCPGPMDTEFFDVAYVPEGSSKFMDSLPRVSPQRVAEASLRLGRRRRATYTSGLFYKFFHLLTKILPSSLLIKFMNI